jgi:hypothetical protein
MVRDISKNFKLKKQHSAVLDEESGELHFEDKAG